MIDVLFKGFGFCHSHHPLRGCHRERSVGGNLSSQVHRLIEQRVVLHNTAHQPKSFGLCGINRATGKEQFGCLCVSDHPRKQPRAAALGKDAAFGEAQCEFRRLCCNAHVASESDVEPIASSATVDGRDGGGIERMQNRGRRVTKIDLLESAVAGQHPGTFCLRLDIKASAKGPTVSSEHNDANIAIVVGPQEQIAHQIEHRRGDRVHAVRPIERDRRDVVDDVVQQLWLSCCGHGSQSSTGPRGGHIPALNLVVRRRRERSGTRNGSRRAMAPRRVRPVLCPPVRHELPEVRASPQRKTSQRQRTIW